MKVGISIEHPDELHGWHLAGCELYKRGVYKLNLSRWTKTGAEMRTAFCDQSVLRIAREQGIIHAGNGFTLP